jgi:hypothetical protein
LAFGVWRFKPIEPTKLTEPTKPIEPLKLIEPFQQPTTTHNSLQ